MRKLKLLFTGLAFLGGVFSANAQTDVTSTYLTNSDFEGSYTELYQIRNDGRYIYQPNGWTVDYKNESVWNMTVVASTDAMASNFTGTYAVPEDNQKYMVRFRDNKPSEYIDLSQTITVTQAGVYTFSADLIREDGSKVNVALYAGSNSVSNSTSNTWENRSVSVSLAANEEIKVGIRFTNLAADGKKLGADNIKITWTDPLKAAKDALQAEIDAVEGSDYATELASAIATAQDVLDNATSEEELTNAKIALHDEFLRSKNGLTEAAYNNPIVTSFVVNGTFDNSDISMWFCNNSFQNKGRKTSDDGNAGNMNASKPWWENWNGSSLVNKMYQTIEDIPNGTYRLDITAFVNKFDAESQYVFANNSQTPLTEDAKSGANYEVYTVVTNNTIEVGFEQTTATANWMGIDNVSLRYYGAGDVVNDAKNASHKLAWLEAKDAAEAARDNSDYENVLGSEKVALLAEIAKAEPTTAEGYDEAAAALTSATQTFVNAKTNYDIFATYNTTLAYADPAKKPSIDEETTAASIIPALRAYYESHALAEGVEGAENVTSCIANATDPTNNDGWTWTGSKNNPASNEPWTDADGNNTHSYFDGGNWNGSNWTTTMKQTISLPVGKYLLTAKGRAATNTTLTMAVGEANVELPHVSSTGNVFDRGWGDGSVEFTTDGSDVEIVVTATAEPTHEWFSISDFRLMRLELNTDAYAGATEYAALNAAIETAEAKTLGFEDGLYAPYNNVEALEALAAAKAIDQTAELTNLKADVEAVTEALADATWTANEAEVNAFYDGDFAIQPEHTTGPTALNGWSNPEGIRQLIKNTTDYPGLTYASGKAAVFAWGNTSMTYGDTEGYTMPLNAHTIYELSFKTCGWKDGDMGYVSVSVKNANSEGLGDTHSVTATKRINEEESDPWDEFKILFVTGEAGNYTFGMWTSKHTTFTDLKLVKAASQILTIADTDTKANWAPGTYANVTLDRTLSSEYWNTFSVPFDAAIPSGWTVKEYDSENSADNVIAFKDATSLVAGVPYLVKPSADAVNPTFNNVVVQATEGTTIGEGDYKFAAQIYNKSLAYDGTIAYLSTNGNVKKLTSGGIKGLRAYFIIPAGGSDARISFGGEETGIQFVDAQNASSNAIYDMQGRKVNNVKKGIYVVNGKKVIK